MRVFLIALLTIVTLGSPTLAADRIVHYEHFTADW